MTGAALAGPQAGALTPALSRGLESVEGAQRAQRCTRCHRARGAEWAASQHAGAFTDPIFQVSWRERPDGWCLNCHLPLAGAQREAVGRTAVPGAVHTPLAPYGPHPATEPARGLVGMEGRLAGRGGRLAGRGGRLADDGVGCPACHVRDGVVLTPSAPSWLASLAHPSQEAPDLQTAEFCAGCHEFPFQLHTPPLPFAYGETPLQQTFSEWSLSAAAEGGQTCQSCHMPDGAHTWPGAHDRALVRGALSVRVEAPPDEAALATVTATGAAHAVPTGDPFRRMILTLCADPGCQEPVGEAKLLRRFAATESSWVLDRDTTVPPATDGDDASRTLQIPVSSPPAWWRLTYEFGDARFHEDLTEDEIRYVVAEGPIAAPDP